LTTRTSKAWVLRSPRGLSLEEIPLPSSVSPGSAIARVEACGVCGSDYEQYAGNIAQTGGGRGRTALPYPLVMGHEPVVRIEEISSEAAERWQAREGDRVAVEIRAGCGVCAHCMSGHQALCPRKLQYGYTSLNVGSGLWGGLAGHMVLAGNTVVHKLPESLSTEDALMFNPMTHGFDWAILTGHVGIGDDVLILGAGQRGLTCVIACVLAGANRIIISGLESDREKLGLARRLGATDTIVTDPDDPASVLDQIGTNCVDRVIDVVPGATRPVVDALQAVRPGGRVTLGGLKGAREVPGFVSDDIIFKAIEVVGAYGASSKAYQLAVRTVVSGRFDFSGWHTHTMKLADAEEAIKILGGEVKTGKAPIHVSVLGS
jgi:threonine dehydrogenase-like Zn-dependent dehydrogenase